MADDHSSNRARADTRPAWLPRPGVVILLWLLINGASVGLALLTDVGLFFLPPVLVIDGIGAFELTYPDQSWMTMTGMMDGPVEPSLLRRVGAAVTHALGAVLAVSLVVSSIRP